MKSFLTNAHVQIILIFIGIFVLINITSSQADMNADYRKITPQDALERLNSQEKIVLLDVRTPEENMEKRIPKSLLIPLDALEKEVRKEIEDLTSSIFVYCRSGRRSEIAAKILLKLGYENVFDLGGIIDWPYETESGKQ